MQEELRDILNEYKQNAKEHNLQIKGYFFWDKPKEHIVVHEITEDHKLGDRIEYYSY